MKEAIRPCSNNDKCTSYPANISYIGIHQPMCSTTKTNKDVNILDWTQDLVNLSQYIFVKKYTENILEMFWLKSIPFYFINISCSTAYTLT